MLCCVKGVKYKIQLAIKTFYLSQTMHNEMQRHALGLTVSDTLCSLLLPILPSYCAPAWNGLLLCLHFVNSIPLKHYISHITCSLWPVKIPCSLITFNFRDFSCHAYTFCNILNIFMGNYFSSNSINFLTE